MRAKVFNGVEGAANVVKRDLSAVFQFHRRPAAGRDRLGPPDGDCFAGAVRLSFVLSVFPHSNARSGSVRTLVKEYQMLLVRADGHRGNQAFDFKTLAF